LMICPKSHIQIWSIQIACPWNPWTPLKDKNRLRIVPVPNSPTFNLFSSQISSFSVRNKEIQVSISRENSCFLYKEVLYIFLAAHVWPLFLRFESSLSVTQTWNMRSEIEPTNDQIDAIRLSSQIRDVPDFTMQCWNWNLTDLPLRLALFGFTKRFVARNLENMNETININWYCLRE
jgi:hypothetical protein